MTARPSTAKSYDLPHEEEVLQVLRDFGVKRAQLFGSAARRELTPTSDIDLLVEFGDELDYLTIFKLSETLEALVGRPFDVVVNLEPVFWPYVEPDLIELAI